MNARMAAAVAAAASLIALGGCAQRGPTPSNGPAAAAAAAAKAVPVRVQRLEPRDFVDYLRVTGTVLARSKVNVVAEEGGILKQVIIDKGNTAKAGAALAVLDNPVLVAGRDQAAAALKQAELDQTTKKALYDKKAIAENEYLFSNYSLEAARAAYSLVQARVDKLTLRTPISGIVNRRYYDLGAYVTPMTPAFEVIDIERLRVRAGVAERFIGDVGLGTPVEVTFDAFPDVKVTAPVTYVSRDIDPQSRTFDIELEFDNPGRRIAPAMAANLRVRYQSLHDRIVIPLDALIEGPNGWYVFVDQGGRAKRVDVQQLSVSGSEVLVEGLAPGQNLVVSGQRSLSEGDPLELK
jgi:membrane fusion protein (multidrug efflux system)